MNRKIQLEVNLRSLAAIAVSLIVVVGGFSRAAGTATRMEGNTLVFDGSAGNRAFSFDVDGLRGDFGTGADDYIASDGTNLSTPAALTVLQLEVTNGTVGLGNTGTISSGDGVYSFYDGPGLGTVTGYIASGTPFYVSTYGLGAALTAGDPLGGFQLNTARDVEIQAMTLRINTAGAGGNTNAVIRLSDGMGDCDCSFACNTGAGTNVFACTGSCAFSMTQPINIDVNSIGDCATGPLLDGDINFEYFYQ